MTSADPPKAGRREWIGLAVLALAALVYVMDLTVLHLAVPAISRDLHPSSSQLLWIIDIYGFTVAGFLVTMGAVGDRIGRRKLLLIGAGAFGIVSILSAISTSPEMLIASRALLGIAGATIAPSTLSLIFNMFQDPGQRARAIAVWISAFSAGSAIGPVIGGVLLERFWWGSVFLIALPVMGLLLVLGPIVLPEYRDPKAGRLDVGSAIMSLVAVLAVVFGLKQIAQDGIGAVAISAIAIGLVVGVLWVRRQLASADPIIDLRLFRVPAFSASLVVNFLTIFVAIGYFLFVAQYLQLVVGLSPLVAGLCSVPSAIGFIVGSNLAPVLVRRFPSANVMGGSLVVAAVGLVLLTQVDAANGLPVVIVASVVIALGLAPVLTLTTDLIVGSAPPERAGAASGISETAVELGGALGISLLGSLGVAIYRGDLSRLPAGLAPDAAATARDTLGGAVKVARSLPDSLGLAVLDVSRSAFVQAMQVAATISAVVAVAVAVFAVAMLRHASSAAGESAERPSATPETDCFGRTRGAIRSAVPEQ
jgi:DHA2 family multidrug resistance protein-like MFS transporter